MLKSGLLILSGNAATALLTLARNLLVARLISVENFGIAATFAISLALVEMMSALGMQQQIVQSKDGNDPRLQAALQGFQVLRAAVNSVVLFLLAAPIAQFLGVPQVTWAYQVIAVVPLLNGLIHFDVYRMNRQMKYLPAVLTTAVPALISVLAVWPLHLLYGDYRVMLYAVLIQGVLAVAMSHLVAERRYALVFDRAIMANSLRFGWPLLINGVLLFVVFNGEKLIVGRELGMAMLAIFAMGFTLTLTPTLVMAKSVQSFFLPQLSAAKEDAAAFLHLAMATLQASLLNGAAMVVAVVLVGAPLVHLLLGPKYEGLLPFLTWLAILQAVRVFKSGGAVVALARAKTENAMVANLFRVLSLPLSWYVAATSGDLMLVIWIAVAGEICGYGASLLLVRYRLGLPLGRMVWPNLVMLALLGAAAVHAALVAMPVPAAVGGTPAAWMGPGWMSPDWLNLDWMTPERWAAAAVVGLFGLLGFVTVDFRRYVVRRRITRYTD